MIYGSVCSIAKNFINVEIQSLTHCSFALFVHCGKHRCGWKKRKETNRINGIIASVKKIHCEVYVLRTKRTVHFV